MTTMGGAAIPRASPDKRLEPPTRCDRADGERPTSSAPDLRRRTTHSRISGSHPSLDKQRPRSNDRLEHTVGETFQAAQTQTRKCAEMPNSSGAQGRFWIALLAEECDLECVVGIADPGDIGVWRVLTVVVGVGLIG